MNDIDEFFVNLGIMDSRQLAAHQFRRVDCHVVGEDAPRLLRPDLDRVQRQLAFVQVEIERVVQTRVFVLHLVHQHIAEFLGRQSLAAQNRFSSHLSPL